MRRLIWVVTVFVLASCDLAEDIAEGFDETEFVERTVVYFPVAYGGNSNPAFRRDGPCSNTPGTGVPMPERAQWLDDGGPGTAVRPGIVPVSYANTFIRGADPFPCNEWQFPVMQGVIRFSLGGIPDGAVVQNAELYFRSRRSNTGGRPAINDTRDCMIDSGTGFAEIGIPPMSNVGSIEVRPIGPLIAYAGAQSLGFSPVNVTSLTREMVARPAIDQEFIISPKPLIRRQEHDVSVFGTVRYCARHLTDISLRIDVLEPMPR
ncbi:MAG: hypothetical protein AAGK37_02410 [Pseudomonadota bacterium]